MHIRPDSCQLFQLNLWQIKQGSTRAFVMASVGVTLCVLHWDGTLSSQGEVSVGPANRRAQDPFVLRHSSVIESGSAPVVEHPHNRAFTPLAYTQAYCQFKQFSALNSFA